MRYKISIPLVAMMLLAGVVTFNTKTAAQNEEEQTRGGFITSRPTTVSASVGGSVGGGVSTGGSSSAPRRKPRRRPANARNTQRNTNRNTNTTVAANANANANANVKAYSGPALGMGYTLYMRDSNGEAVRVDPSRSFRTGERVRILLETNTDGYLYIFNTTDNGDPVMIYPDVRLDDGGNYIEAHVPIEIPSREEQDENFRWFTFDNKPGTERLYIVFSRDPLPGVPIEDDLVKYCGQGGQNCPWRPSASLWAQVKAGMNARVQVARSKTYGQAQTSGEADAVNRGVGLTRSAPEPSVIRINASSTSGLLVTVLELAHS
ncbi:MAG: DUF4384 domain-containing protein [Pyrinomonadaceae bacterium]|nr:DUF4384 domain-containing protein [Pyrinomonadaceae bacterium]